MDRKSSQKYKNEKIVGKWAQQHGKAVNNIV